MVGGSEGCSSQRCARARQAQCAAERASAANDAVDSDTRGPFAALQRRRSPSGSGRLGWGWIVELSLCECRVGSRLPTCQSEVSLTELSNGAVPTRTSGPSDRDWWEGFRLQRAGGAESASDCRTRTLRQAGSDPDYWIARGMVDRGLPDRFAAGGSRSPNYRWRRARSTFSCRNCWFAAGGGRSELPDYRVVRCLVDFGLPNYRLGAGWGGFALPDYRVARRRVDLGLPNYRGSTSGVLGR
jgi:hypothetical protein